MHRNFTQMSAKWQWNKTASQLQSDKARKGEEKVGRNACNLIVSHVPEERIREDSIKTMLGPVPQCHSITIRLYAL